MTDYADLLPVAHEAVDLARDIMRSMQPGVLTAKGDRDMASEVDYAIEQRVRDLLATRTPDIGFLGEEEGATDDDAELMWALDPVDGTVNFIHGSPLCAVSLGLIHQKCAVVGVIDLPFLGDRYFAAEKCGAHVNGKKVSASKTASLRDAVVAIGDYAVGAGAAEKNLPRFALTEALASRVQRIRMHGTAALDFAWLAAAKVDAVIMLSNKPWDTAAGVVLAREAGAVVLDSDGSDHSFESVATVACAPALRVPLLDAMNKCLGQ